MSLEQRRTAVTLEMHQRVLAVIRAHKGRATIDQIREAEVIPGALVQETLRQLISAKSITMHGTGTYAVRASVKAESPQLAGPLAVDSTEQSGRTAEEVDATTGGPAEPIPRRRGRPKQGGTTAPSMADIECCRCHLFFPPDEFTPALAGGRRFRLCKGCRSHRQLVTQSQPFARLPLTSVMADYLNQLIATGLYGSSAEQVVERLVCDGIARAIVSGIVIKQATGERP